MSRLEYLSRLEREAGPALAAEARDHLEQAMQARIELGMSPEEAEAEALATFGAARAVAQEVRRREPRVDRTFLGSCLAVALTAGAVGIVREPSYAWVLVLLYFALVSAHAAFVVASVHARRLQFRALALVLLPLWVGWATFQASGHVVAPMPQTGDDHRMSRVWVPDEVRTDREWAARIRRENATLGAGHAAFLREGGVESPSRRASFTEDGRLRLFRRADHATAAEYWNAAVENGLAFDERSARSIEAQAQALEEALDDPWWPNLPIELAFAMKDVVAPIAGAYVAVHLIAWLMGRVILRLRRLRRLAL